MRPPGERAGWSVLPLPLPSAREVADAVLGRADCRPAPPPLPVECNASRSPSMESPSLSMMCVSPRRQLPRSGRGDAASPLTPSLQFKRDAPAGSPPAACARGDDGGRRESPPVDDDVDDGGGGRGGGGGGGGGGFHIARAARRARGRLARDRGRTRGPRSSSEARASARTGQGRHGHAAGRLDAHHLLPLPLSVPFSSCCCSPPSPPLPPAAAALWVGRVRHLHLPPHTLPPAPLPCSAASSARLRAGRRRRRRVRRGPSLRRSTRHPRHRR